MINDTQKQIMSAALNLFKLNGYNGTTLGMIAEASGFSTDLIKHYYTSKQKCFSDCVSYYLYVLQNIVDKSVNNLKEYIENVHSRLFGLYNEPPIKTFLDIYFDGLEQIPNFATLSKMQGKQELNSWREVMKKAVTDGDITTAISVDKLASLCMHITNGIDIYVMNTNEKPTIKDIEHQWNNFYKMLKA